MHIRLNEQWLQLTASCTVAELLQQQQIPPQGLAVAINNTVIAKRQWPAQQLNDNDCVNIFHIVTGG
ncbi:sulfur carrier protein ThiS [Rheinheimera nanhaiensis]|uniref:Thiamine biosynthesis protein ThiS n=1 Tax=Rheinheimera nanhaiensis E407-8 TaxID=562729 RepID=I1E0K3_9GAMM|nr:sulfur carrier protein ThiS [Rheinheimera nanhaiensis]GAB59831.1 thiamine biosynthesis protein ThiS [Rheinheimera nanhaiensis E407-8]